MKPKKLWAVLFLAFLFASCAGVRDFHSIDKSGISEFVEKFYFNKYKRELSFSGDIAILKPYLSDELYRRFVHLRNAANSIDGRKNNLLLATRVHNIDFFYGYSITPDKFNIMGITKKDGYYIVHVRIGWSNKVNKNMNIDSAEMDVIVKNSEMAGGTYVIENVIFSPRQKKRGNLHKLLERATRALTQAQ